jgi:trans-aconitate methyltransferase
MISERLQAVVDALPLRPDSRVLELGCGPGVAARAVAERLESGRVLAIDRSEKAIALARRGGTSDRLEYRCVAAEDLELEPGEAPYDLVFAARVGALDGRHPRTGERVLERLAAVTTADARLFVDGLEVERWREEGLAA